MMKILGLISIAAGVTTTMTCLKLIHRDWKQFDQVSLAALGLDAVVGL